MRVRVWAYDDEESERASTALAAAGATEVSRYDGCVTADIAEAALPDLIAQGLLAEALTVRPTLHREAGEDSDRQAAADRLTRLAEDVDADLPERPDAEACLIAISGVLDSAARERLRAASTELLEWIPPASMRALLTADQQEAVRQLPFVGEVAVVRLVDRVDPRLVDLARALAQPSPAPPRRQLLGAPTLGVKPPPPRLVDFVLNSRGDVAAFRVLAASLGVDVLEEYGSTLRCTIPDGPAALAALATRPEVAMATPVEFPTLWCDTVRPVMVPEEVPGLGPLDGSGQIVAVIDSGVFAAHPDLADRIHTASAFELAGREGSAEDHIGHGTHVIGIIAGTGKASGGTIRGMAPGAQIHSLGIVDDKGALILPLDLGRLLQPGYDAGARIFNLSWGRPMAPAYDQCTESLDRFCHDHPDALVLVAAGNEGKAMDGTPALWSLAAPACARNVLTVGATCSPRPGVTVTWHDRDPARFPQGATAEETISGDASRVAALSSRGPTGSLEVKPEVVAPGSWVLSTRSPLIQPRIKWGDGPDEHYVYSGGTSMATPVISGTAACLRQFLMHRGLTPSGALMKALLVASTTPLPAPFAAQRPQPVGYPDFDQGFGRPDLRNVLPADGRHLWVLDIASTGPGALEGFATSGGPIRGSSRVDIDVEAGPLTVVLCWTDVPAKGVQNNLDIDLQRPDFTRVFGNPTFAFVPRPPTGQDRTNTTEMVRLDDAEAGPWKLFVRAVDTPSPPQGYSLVLLGRIKSASGCTQVY